MIPLLLGICVYATVGDYIWTKTFWVNMAEYHIYAANEAGNSFADLMKQKPYLYLSIGLSYVFIYVGSLLYSIQQIFQNPSRRRMLLCAALSIYGLCMHAYFVGTLIKYSSFGLPCVFLLFFWLDEYCQHCKLPKQRILRHTALGLCVFFLISTPMFTAYPNFFNLSRNPIVDTNVSIKLDNGGLYFNQLYLNFPEALQLPVNSLGETDEGLRYEIIFKQTSS